MPRARKWAKAIGVKYVPGMRYCMFIASSRILSPLKQIAAALNKIALTNDQPTPTQATTYDQSYEISELSFRTQGQFFPRVPCRAVSCRVAPGVYNKEKKEIRDELVRPFHGYRVTWHNVLNVLGLFASTLPSQAGCRDQEQRHRAQTRSHPEPGKIKRPVVPLRRVVS